MFGLVCCILASDREPWTSSAPVVISRVRNARVKRRVSAAFIIGDTSEPHTGTATVWSFKQRLSKGKQSV